MTDSFNRGEQEDSKRIVGSPPEAIIELSKPSSYIPLLKVYEAVIIRPRKSLVEVMPYV